MKKLMTIFGAMLFIAFINEGCGGKPKLCDCQNEFWRLIEIGGSSSGLMDNCEKYYNAEQMIYAKCGLSNYDPNYEAK